ncbi:MAG: Gfo/Idh/MocA family protein [Thermoguttaceae bacterium]
MTLNVGLVGCGGRGRGAAVMALRNAGYNDVKLIAVADAFAPMAKGAAEALKVECEDKVDVPPARVFSGLDCCQRLLETDVDVVLHCEPPGFRPRHVAASVAAGKHVFAEKPVATDIPGLRIFDDAVQSAKKKKLSLLVGHHLRHETKHIEPIKMLHDGAIGDVLYTRIFFNMGVLWTRPRRDGQSEMEHQVTNWYYFNWLSGDQIVEQHVHDIDVMNWMMRDEHPVSASGMGGRQARLGPEYGEIFDHHFVEFVYPNGVHGYSQCRQINNCWDSFSEHAVGTKGRLDIEGHGTAVLTIDGKEPIRWKREHDGHQIEMDTLFGTIGRGDIVNTGDIAVTATTTAILGRMATYCGKIVTWDDCVNSTLDIFPKSLAWDAAPNSKPFADGTYPSPIPGQTQAF